MNLIEVCKIVAAVATVATQRYIHRKPKTLAVKSTRI
jgi:hypothetical protein